MHTSKGIHGVHICIHMVLLRAHTFAACDCDAVVCMQTMTCVGWWWCRRGCSACQVWLTRANKLVTCAKDGLIKVWDLDTQHCCQTLQGAKVSRVQTTRYVLHMITFMMRSRV